MVFFSLGQREKGLLHIAVSKFFGNGPVEVVGGVFYIKNNLQQRQGRGFLVSLDNGKLIIQALASLNHITF